MATMKRVSGVPGITSGRIEDAVLIDGRNNQYALGDKSIVAVLDGDVVLDKTCFEIQHDEGIIQMKRQPVFRIRLLVQ